MNKRQLEQTVKEQLARELEDEADLYENAPCGYISVLPDGTIIKLNRTFLSWVNLDREDVIYRMNFEQFLTVPGKIYYNTHHLPLLKMQGFVNELSYEIQTETKKIPVLINTTLVRSDSGDIKLIRFVILDITDRKKFETELIRSRKREMEEKKKFRFMAEKNPSVIWTTDKNGIIQYVNSKFEAHTGTVFSRRAMVEKIHPNDLSACIERWKRSIREVLAFEMEIRILNVTNEYEWFIIKANPYCTDGGLVSSWFGSGTNINTTRQIQERMDEFISIASHELKTPMTTVKANLDLLLHMLNDEKLLRFTRKAFESTNKLIELVNSLLDVSKIQAGHIQFNKDRININKVAENAVESIKHVFPDSRITLRETEKDNYIFADQVRIEQVISNLLSNALKYSPKNEEVDLSIKRQAGSVIVAVKDRGIGIEKEKLGKIFERFYRALDKKTGNRFNGLGIGLYITQQIVKEHEGKIWVQSELNKGSSFFVSFPAITA